MLCLYREIHSRTDWQAYFSNKKLNDLTLYFCLTSVVHLFSTLFFYCKLLGHKIQWLVVRRMKKCLTVTNFKIKWIDGCGVLTLFYMGGGQKDPPGWLSYTNPQGMPQMGWFFMTLFLSILERSWVGHFWDFFLKNQKNFTSTIFSTYNPKGGPFYASVRTPSPSFFFPFLSQIW